MEREHGRLFRCYLEEYVRADGKTRKVGVRTIKNESTREMVARALGREDAVAKLPVADLAQVVERVNKKCGVPWRAVVTQKPAQADIAQQAIAIVRDALNSDVDDD